MNDEEFEVENEKPSKHMRSLGYGAAPLILGSVLALFSAWAETDTFKQKRDQLRLPAHIGF
jgi:hypothetical protein